MRWSAWTARNAAARDLRHALSAPDHEALGFEPEGAALCEARDFADTVQSLADDVLGRDGEGNGGFGNPPPV